MGKTFDSIAGFFGRVRTMARDQKMFNRVCDGIAQVLLITGYIFWTLVKAVFFVSVVIFMVLAVAYVKGQFKFEHAQVRFETAQANFAMAALAKDKPKLAHAEESLVHAEKGLHQADLLYVSPAVANMTQAQAIQAVKEYGQELKRERHAR